MSRRNEPWHTHEWFMSHTRKSHGIHESCPTQHKLASIGSKNIPEELVISHIWMSHCPHVDVSYEWVTAYMSHVPHTYEWAMVQTWRNLTHESRYKRVMSHTTRLCNHRVKQHLQVIIHITHTNEPWHTHQWLIQLSHGINESCPTQHTSASTQSNNISK